MKRKPEQPAFKVFVCSSCGHVENDEYDNRSCPKCDDSSHYSRHFVNEKGVATYEQAEAFCLAKMRKEYETLGKILKAHKMLPPAMRWSLCFNDGKDNDPYVACDTFGPLLDFAYEAGPLTPDKTREQAQQELQKDGETRITLTSEHRKIVIWVFNWKRA